VSIEINDKPVRRSPKTRHNDPSLQDLGFRV
jgi:hypothetical protein